MELKNIFTTEPSAKAKDLWKKDKTQNIQSFRPTLFNEFSSKDKEKIAASIEVRSKEFFIAPTVETYVYCTARALDFGDFHGTLDKSAKWESAVNKNADLFNYDEIVERHPKAGYERYLTYRTASVFTNHNSSNPENAIGLVFDATMLKDKYADMHITILMGVDKTKSPGIARTLINYPDRVATSMGCSITSSICTVCGTEVKKESDFCDCLKHHRGGHYKGVKVAELLKGPTFYEQSCVVQPACDTAYVIDSIAEILPGRLLKVASEKGISEEMQIMNTLYTSIREAKTYQEKKRLNNQLDYLIARIELMV